MGRKQYIAVTVDFCDGIVTSSRADSDYAPVYEGCKAITGPIRDAFKKEKIKFTFFVRADHQIKFLFDRVSALFDRYRPLWLEVKQKGDEIGWHPHLYKLRGSVWMPQTDGPGVERQLKSCYVELPMDVFNITCARIGEGMMTNYSINTLDKLGIKADCTALPGRTRNDKDRKFNWSKAPAVPYHPSRFNYSSVGLPGGNLSLLEIPFTMVETQASYDEEPLKRYLDLTFSPEFIGPGLKDALKRSPFTVAVIHPSFILGGGGDSEIISPGIETVKQNIANIVAAARSIGRDPEFVCIRDILEQVGKRVPG
jgi:hypothetical protein